MAHMTDGICLANIEGRHIGGALRTLHGFTPDPNAARPGMPAFDNNGHHMVGQMYAQYFWQSAPRSPLPLALWHGGGLSGASWENTPDNRPGWLNYFLRARYHVVLCDAFERGRAGLPAYPQAIAERPEYRSIDAIWHHFRLGPAGACPHDLQPQALRAQAYPGLQFPIEQLEQFGRQFVPRFAHTDAHILAAYRAFLEHTGPCVLVAHSQGASFALECARLLPELVRAVVAVEPPVSQRCLDALAATDAALPPHLFVWGDFIRQENRTWSACLANAEHYHAQLGARGAPSSFMELPLRGMRGNSHMLQMEGNNQEIAALVAQWLAQHAG